MRRTHALVLARLRLIALRWRADAGGGGGPNPGGVPNPGSVPNRVPNPGGADEPAEPADLEELGELGGGADEPAELEEPRTPPRMVVRLLGLLSVAILLLGAGALVRSWPRPAPMAAPSPAAADPGRAHGLADPFSSPSPSPAASLVVHVVGQVRRPGVVVLPAGSRVADAVAAAGGLRRGRDIGTTNLARLVADGERIEVGLEGGPADTSGTGDATGAGAGAAAAVDLNTATSAQLDALPGVGPVTAAKILAWRAEHGRFTLVDELAEIPGIGPKTLEELRPHVRV